MITVYRQIGLRSYPQISHPSHTPLTPLSRSSHTPFLGIVTDCPAKHADMDTRCLQDAIDHTEGCTVSLDEGVEEGNLSPII